MFLLALLGLGFRGLGLCGVGVVLVVFAAWGFE